MIYWKFSHGSLAFPLRLSFCGKLIKSIGINSSVLNKQKENCWNCSHFGITHEKNFPYKCNAMNFKSRQLPSDIVVKVEGDRCLSFLKKPGWVNLLRVKCVIQLKPWTWWNCFYYCSM